MCSLSSQSKHESECQNNYEYHCIDVNHRHSTTVVWRTFVPSKSSPPLSFGAQCSQNLSKARLDDCVGNKSL